MFQTVPLSIIRSFYTVHTAMVYGIQVLDNLSLQFTTAFQNTEKYLNQRYRIIIAEY